MLSTLSSLPPEILDNIISHVVEDQAATAKLIRTCRRLFELGVTYLYANIRIGSRQATQLLKTLKQNPELADHVRVMRFEYSDTELADRNTMKLLKALPNLQEMAITRQNPTSGSSGRSWMASHSFPTANRQDILDLFRTVTWADNDADIKVEHKHSFLLHLKHATFSLDRGSGRPWNLLEMEYFLRSTTLESLTFKNGYIAPDVVEFSEFPETAFVDKTSIKDLRLIACDISGFAFNWLLTVVAPLTRLHYVHCAYGTADRSRPPFLHFAEGYFEAIVKHADTLQHLSVLGLQSPKADVARTTFKDFPKLLSLETSPGFLGLSNESEAHLDHTWTSILPSQLETFTLWSDPTYESMTSDTKFGNGWTATKNSSGYKVTHHKS